MRTPALIALIALIGCGSAEEVPLVAEAPEHERPSPTIEPGGEAPGAPDDLVRAEAPATSPVEARDRWRTPHGELDVVVLGDGPLGVVLLHGYGAPPEDMVPLARELAPRTPSTIVVPTSPRTWRPGGEGRAWFERTATDASGQIERARDEVEALLARLRDEGHDRVVVAGFSQGASLSIEVALHAGEAGLPLAGVIALSGRDLPRYRGRWSALRGLPMLSSHGRGDPVIPFSSGTRIAAQAEEAGALARFVAFDGAHAMPPEVREQIATFLRSLAAAR